MVYFLALIFCLCFLSGYGFFHTKPPRQVKEPLLLETLAQQTPHFRFEKGEEWGEINYSSKNKGYVMIACRTRRKAYLSITQGGETSWQPLVTDGQYHPYLLNSGSGDYTLRVYFHFSSTKYIKMGEVDFPADITAEFDRFLIPTQTVPFTQCPPLYEKAARLYSTTDTDLEFADKCLRWVSRTISYDVQAAEYILTEKPDLYQPDLYTVYQNRTGICLDYAAMFAAMMRSCGVPCQVVYGSVHTQDSELYHAWNLVWLEVDGVGGWWRFDPTLGIAGVDLRTLVPGQAVDGVLYGEPTEIH